MKLQRRTAAVLLLAVVGLSSALASNASVTLNAAVTVAVDANAGRHTISPYVYGVAYGDATTLADLNAPFNRYGGNNASRYNWQINADNRGSDWYFESIPYASATPGEVGDSFVAASRSLSWAGISRSSARSSPSITATAFDDAAPSPPSTGNLFSM